MSSLNSRLGPQQDRGSLLSIEHSKTAMLPELRSGFAVDKTKPLATSLQSDFIPEDILFALTQPLPSKDKLGPLTRTRNLNTTSGAGRPPPDNVWNHKRRERFKHLMENTPCACGAGRDISFLYDVPQSTDHPEKPELLDNSSVRKEPDRTGKPLHLPDTLIPDEYHIVKNKGVLGIEYHEDKYSTKPEDHEKHLVMFPSLKPASRYEVIKLKTALNNMLDKVGVNDLETEHSSGPTQMHSLLDLIKKEQNIYNVVFHELIRQTSIECVERGELLADLRNKYSELLNKVPQQIMSLHEEVMAQRALDRRLTEELMRFKGTIGVLTSELSDVQEHDRRVTKEAQNVQEDLRSALTESQKNASLLSEYHDLYELQRRRLERQVFVLSEEREIWSTASYSLALKVTEEYRLKTAKRLQLNEKGWVKMATHFTILLSDQDTDLLTKIQGCVENWRDLIEDFNIALKQRENEMSENFRTVRAGVQTYINSFQRKFLDQDLSVVKKPDVEFAKHLLAGVRTWDEAIMKETEVFGGDNLLTSQEEITQIRHEMEGWTDNALKVFGRHRGSYGKTHKDQSAMLALNEEVDELLTQFQHRITGENGVAGLVIHLQSSLETWETRLASHIQGVITLQESDWGALYQTLEEWLALLDKALTYVGTTQREEDRQDGRPHSSSKKVSGPPKPHIHIDIHDVARNTQKWATTSSNSIDSEDAKLVEQVSSFHSEMVRWMVQVLLRLAPDKDGNSKEAAEMVLLGSASIPELTEVAKTLFESLETFSTYVALCCHGIVRENTQARQNNDEDNADHEMNDLKRLRTECDDWVLAAQLLMSQLTGESIAQLFPTCISTAFSQKSETVAETPAGTTEETPAETPADSTRVTPTDRVAFADQEKLQKDDVTSLEHQTSSDLCQETTVPDPETISQIESSAQSAIKYDEDIMGTQQPDRSEQVHGTQTSEQEQIDSHQSVEQTTKELPDSDTAEQIEVLGSDANTHKHSLEGPDLKTLGSELMTPGAEGSPDTKKAFEALAAIEILQSQLIAAEERAQLAEERAAEAELDIMSLEEKVRALEKQTDKQPVVQRSKAPSHPPSAAGTTALSPTKTDSPHVGVEGREEKSVKKSARSSGKSSKKK